MSVDTTLADLALADGEIALEMPLVLYARRSKGITIALVLGLLAAAMVWAATTGVGAWAWAVAVVCLLLAGVGVAMAVRPAILRIAEEGFSVHAFVHRLRGREPVTVPWTHVDGFAVVRIGQGSFVRYEYTAASGHVRVPGGVVLPDTFGMSAPLLAEMLQAIRDDIVAVGQAPAAT
jgi:hypothetical protein